MPAQEKPPEDKDLWQEIGFHRPLGGFWFNYVLVLVAAVFSILFVLYLLPNLILPFPEAIGFQDLVKNFFALYFMLADVGIGRAVLRFIAEDNVKDPERSIHYLQFFIWFQMMSGLVQVTLIAFLTIWWAPTTNLAYTMWFFLLYSTIQYPGMLGVFQGALEGFQRFHKLNTLVFLQGALLENSTRVLCILLGRYLGAQNPAIGELMGATLGSIIGAYLDDFIAAVIGAFWLKPILQEINPMWGVKNLFMVQFDSTLAKRCLWFGFRAILPSSFHQISQLVMTLLLIHYLPNYGTIWGLYSIAEMVSGVAGTFRFKMASTISEAANNGKWRLVENYTTRAYRWLGITYGFMAILIFAAAPLLGIIAGEQYAMAAVIIQVLVLGRFTEGFGSINADIFIGCDKPEYYIIINFCEISARIGFMFVLLVPVQAGWYALAISRIAGWVARFIMGIFLVKRLFRLKVNLWQTAAAPIIAGLGMYGVIWGIESYIFPFLATFLGEVLTAIILAVLVVLFIPLLIFFPLYALLGGWDDGSLEIFRIATEISGPSKPLVLFIHRVSQKLAQVSPLTNRFPISNEGVVEEMRELVMLRNKKLREVKELGV